MGAKSKSKTHLQNTFFDLFSRFLRICSQSMKKIITWPKIIIFLKVDNNVKNATFHANFESVEKVLEKYIKKKLLAKTWRKNALFFTFTHVRQTCFAYNFFWCIF